MKGLKYKSQKDCSNISDYAMKYGILLGCHHGLKPSEISYMCATIKRFVENPINYKVAADYSTPDGWLLNQMYRAHLYNDKGLSLSS